MCSCSDRATRNLLHLQLPRPNTYHTLSCLIISACYNKMPVISLSNYAFLFFFKSLFLITTHWRGSMLSSPHSKERVKWFLFLTAGLHIHGDEVLSLSGLWVAWAFCRQESWRWWRQEIQRRGAASPQYEGGTTVAAHCSPRSLQVQEEARARRWPFVLNPNNVQGRAGELECETHNVSAARYKAPEKKKTWLFILLRGKSHNGCRFFGLWH